MGLLLAASLLWWICRAPVISDLLMKEPLDIVDEFMRQRAIEEAKQARDITKIINHQTEKE